jgi:hypothetical protein
MLNNKLPIITVSILGIYLQVMEWINLFPWNNIRNGNGQETLDLILAFVTILLLFLLKYTKKIGLIITSIILIAWLWLQISTWWIPYINGASNHWKKTYSIWFKPTIQLFSRTENNLPPDANHFVLQLLIIIALFSSLFVVFRKKIN